ncbi:MAG TPA: aminodeoxychorismate/anthranilate synthase component II [Thermoplasmata archaeon]|nr:aminodeoxychorismate/anthranilate synthase component II [Thermoplasmata archaeon]HTW56399.1 aminodeoxychorismate/anthranilate synthase component II [Thermoplasmata archaeon]
MRILLVDHEDSFVHNIEQALAAQGAEVRCLRCTVPARAAAAVDPDGIVLSPGPGHPRDARIAGLAHELLDRWGAERPFFGVCLGQQIVGTHFGGRVVRAPSPVHGELATIRHDGRGVFAGLDSPLRGARYHSLVVEPRSLPRELEVSARGGRGLVMGLRHRTQPIETVQFHPESYLTAAGPAILANFLREVRR